MAELHIEIAAGCRRTRASTSSKAAIRAVCEPHFDRPLKEISLGQVLMRLFQTSRRFHVEIQPQLVLLQKTLLNIEGLGRQLDPDLDLWNTAKPFLETLDDRADRPAASCSSELRDEAPRYAKLLPELPRLLHDYLQQRSRPTTAASCWNCWPSSGAPTGCCRALVYGGIGFVLGPGRDAARGAHSRCSEPLPAAFAGTDPRRAADAADPRRRSTCWSRSPSACTPRRRVKNTTDFADRRARSLPLVMIVTTTFATWFGSETVLGIPAKFVEGGLNGVVEDPFGAGTCLILVGLFFAGKLYRMTLLTISDYYRERYGRAVEVVVLADHHPELPGLGVGAGHRARAGVQRAVGRRHQHAGWAW